MAGADGGQAKATLRRRLGLADAVAVFVGTILGSGIFFAPAAVAAAAPGVLPGVALWTVAALVAACGALCYAECGARLPRAGGFFVFYREAWGEPLAFVAGWVGILVTYPASIAAIAHVLADYLGTAVAPGEPASRWPAVVAVSIAAALNVSGVRVGALAQRLLTATKVGALCLLCVAALWAGGGAPAAAATGPLPPLTGPILLTAVLGVAWTYDGWSDVTLLAGELRDPRRDLGRAVLLGLLTLLVTYVLVQVAVVTLLSPSAAAGSSSVVADAARAGLGSRAGALVAVLVVVATFGSINAVVFTASRLGWAMSRAGVFPAAFGSVGRYGTPALSIAGLTVAVLAYVVFSDFRGVLGYFSFSVWIFYALTAGALLRLRARGVGEPLPWRAPGGILPPVVVLLTAALLSGSVLWEDPRKAVLGAVVLALGFVVHAVWRRLTSASRVP